MKDSAVRRWSKVHKALYRLTRGRLGGRLVGNDMLLLTTSGRTTGRPHTVPLLYLREGSTLVVVASFGGRPQNPAWFHNLRADPDVIVEISSRRHRMRASMASPEERAAWWPRIEAAYAGYAEYQSRTDREIPVVLLEPTERQATS